MVKGALSYIYFAVQDNPCYMTFRCMQKSSKTLYLIVFGILKKYAWKNLSFQKYLQFFFHTFFLFQNKKKSYTAYWELMAKFHLFKMNLWSTGADSLSKKILKKSKLILWLQKLILQAESQNFLIAFQQNLSLSIKLGFKRTDLG